MSFFFSLVAAALLATMVAAPILLLVLGVRQYKWWRSTHELTPRPPTPLMH